MRPLNRAAWRFFFENAGYIVGERAKCAATLARAESLAKADDGERIRFRWEWDDSPDLSYMSADEIADAHEVFGCILERKCVECGTWQHAASVWGIVDPDATYRRVVEAELAAEHYFQEN